MQQEQMIKLPNGKEVLNLTPRLDGQLALVHLAVVKRLVELLPEVNFESYKYDFCERLSRINNLETFVGIMADEVTFHQTVNLINTADILSTVN